MGMDLHHVVYDLQAAFSALGAFISVWGFVQFAPCLGRVLLNKYKHPRYHACPRHAVMAVICLAVLIFAFARMNTIGFFIFGATAAGLAYCAGMIIMVFAVALAVWASGKRHELPPNVLSHHQGPALPNLSFMLSMLVIVVLAFLAVGILRLGE